jgi:hypothetical protein
LQASGEASQTALDCGVLAQLMAQAPPAPYEAGPLAAGSALLDQLGALQDGGPVVVVVDDAHWADVSALLEQIAPEDLQDDKHDQPEKSVIYHKRVIGYFAPHNTEKCVVRIAAYIS